MEVAPKSRNWLIDRVPKRRARKSLPNILLCDKVRDVPSKVTAIVNARTVTSFVHWLDQLSQIAASNPRN